MKINHLKRYLIGIVMTAFLALLVGNAFGANAASDNASRDFSEKNYLELEVQDKASINNLRDIIIQYLNKNTYLYFKIDISSVGFGNKETQRVAVTNRSFS